MVGVATALSACLLFCLELWAGKMALPRFGGTASVWTTSLMFFQTVLLLGYGYAHWLTTRFSPARQRRFHAGIVALALTAAIVALLFPLKAGGDANPGVGGVLLFLGRTVGLPFFLLSTTTPLLQVWWVQSRTSAFPWKYYAFSNAGSLLALLIYPLLLEPRVGLHHQEQVGVGAFFLYAAMVVMLAFALKPTAPIAAVTREPDQPLGWPQRLRWLGWAALASTLLGATHNVMCQDVAPTPMLWALPLGVYLLSFVVTFSQAGWYRRAWVLPLLVVGVVWVTYLFFKLPAVKLWLQVAAFCVLQGAASLYCHGELFARRPGVPRLSEFYLWLSAGGALGAVLVSVVAPLVLDDYWEYLAAVVLITVVALTLLLQQQKQAPLWRRAVLASVGVVLVSSFAVGFIEQRRERVISMRDFFGVLRVDEWGSKDKEDHRYALRHGSIIHGAQFVAPERRQRPTTYFTEETGVWQALRLARTRSKTWHRPGLHVAVLGLGVGTTAALLKAEDKVTFYDINPLVVELAEGRGGYFSFLSDSAAKTDVRLGDARLLLEREARSWGGPVAKDVIVVDVFSGDAIPAHLFTRECFELYLKHLVPDGILALHVSNRHLVLERVAFGLSEAMGLAAVVYENAGSDKSSGSTWVLISRDATLLSTLKEQEDSLIRKSSSHAVVWTDDLHSLWSVMR
jgi:spermidine synthase